MLLQVHLKQEKVEFHSWKRCWETWDLSLLTQKTWHQRPFEILQIVPCLQHQFHPRHVGSRESTRKCCLPLLKGWFASPNPECFSIFILAFCAVFSGVQLSRSNPGSDSSEMCQCHSLYHWILKITVSVATAFIASIFPLFLRLSCLISWNSVTKSTQKARAFPCVLNTYAKPLS